MSNAFGYGAPLVGVLLIGAASGWHAVPAPPTLAESAQMGLAYHMLGLPQRGEAVLQGVLAADPNQPRALVNTALIAYRAGRLAEADALLTKALQRDPADFNARVSHGFVLRKLGQHERAREAFGEAHRLAPQEPAPLYNLAVFAYERRDYVEARRLLLAYLPVENNLDERRAATIWVEEIDKRIAAGGARR